MKYDRIFLAVAFVVGVVGIANGWFIGLGSFKAGLLAFSAVMIVGLSVPAYGRDDT